MLITDGWGCSLLSTIKYTERWQQESFRIPFKTVYSLGNIKKYKPARLLLGAFELRNFICWLRESFNIMTSTSSVVIYMIVRNKPLNSTALGFGAVQNQSDNNKHFLWAELTVIFSQRLSLLWPRVDFDIKSTLSAPNGSNPPPHQVQEGRWGLSG